MAGHGCRAGWLVDGRHWMKSAETVRTVGWQKSKPDDLKVSYQIFWQIPENKRAVAALPGLVNFSPAFLGQIFRPQL